MVALDLQGGKSSRQEQVLGNRFSCPCRLLLLLITLRLLLAHNLCLSAQNLGGIPSVLHNYYLHHPQ